MTRIKGNRTHIYLSILGAAATLITFLSLGIWIGESASNGSAGGEQPLDLEGSDEPRSPELLTAASNEEPTASTELTSLTSAGNTPSTIPTRKTTTATTLTPKELLWGLPQTNRYETDAFSPEKIKSDLSNRQLGGIEYPNAFTYGNNGDDCLVCPFPECAWDDAYFVEYNISGGFSRFEAVLGASSGSNEGSQVSFRVFLDEELVSEYATSRLDAAVVEISVADSTFLKVSWILDCDGAAWGVVADPWLVR